MMMMNSQQKDDIVVEAIKIISKLRKHTDQDEHEGCCCKIVLKECLEVDQTPRRVVSTAPPRHQRVDNLNDFSR